MCSYDNGGLVPGINVDIQRTDGRVHSAIVSHISENTNSVTVEWFEKGEAKGKEIELESIYQLNPNLRPKIGADGCERSIQKNDHEDFGMKFISNKDTLITESGDKCLYKSNANFESLSRQDYDTKEMPNLQSTSGMNKSKCNGNSRVPINIRKPQFQSSNYLSQKSKADQSMLDLSCDSQKSFGDCKYNKKSCSACSNGDVCGRNSVQSIISGRMLKAGSKMNLMLSKQHVLKEKEKLYQSKDELRIQHRFSRDSLLLDTSDPNYEFKMMILEFQNSLDYSNLPICDTMEDNRICVCVRKRPLNTKELLRKEIDVITIPNKQVLIVHEPRLKVDLKKYLENQNFRFDFAFDDMSDNFTVYHHAAKPLVESIFENGMATCFAYGQTGSGKTHTMGGDFQTLFQQDSSKGIYGLAARDIFKLINTKYRKENLSVEAAFFEIYGGKVFDLLNKKQKLRVLEDQHGTVQVVGLKEELVSCVDDVLKLIQTGMTLRTSGQTSANQHSSRSHAVLQLILKKRLTKKLHGKFSLIDLAGNERGADTSTADRLTRMEGAEINKSLLALKECIRALGRKGSHLPFRASKLTQVLRDSFIGDNIRTCMIAMISPGMSCCEHTLNTLRYADRVKELIPGKSLPKPDCEEDNYNTKLGTNPGFKELQMTTVDNKYSKTGSKRMSGDTKGFYNSSDFQDREVQKPLSNNLMLKNSTQIMLKEIHNEHNLLIETLPSWLNEHRQLFTVVKNTEYDVEVYTNRLESLILRNIGKLSTLKVKISKWNVKSKMESDVLNTPTLFKNSQQ